MALTLGQRLFAHGGIYVASRLANRGMGIVLLPIYAHYLGTEGYGIVRILAPFGVFAGLLFAQGLPAAWFRLRFDQEGFSELKVFESTVIWYLIASTTLGVVLVSCFGGAISQWITKGIPFFPLGFLTIIGAGLSVFANLYERKLQAEQRPVAFSIYSGIRTLSTLLTIILFVVTFQWGVFGKISAEVLCTGILASVAFLIIRPSSPWESSTARLKEALDFGLPLVPHSLAITTNEMVGILVINSELGLENAGIYGVGLTIGAVSSVLTVGLNQAFSPIFVKAVRESEKAESRGDSQLASEIRSQVARSNLLMPALVGCFALAITTISKETIYFLTPEEFHLSWKVVAPISGAVIAISFYNSFNQSVFYNPKRIRWVAFVSIFTAAVNLGLCVFLVREFGLMGAAFSGLISNTIMALLIFCLGKSATDLTYRWTNWLGVIGLISMGLTIIWFLDASIEGVIPCLLAKVMTLTFFVYGVFNLAGVAPRHAFRFASNLSERIRSPHSKK
ncbi:MAG: oligosaccharide flippase family protein [Candidatus Omnitrophica bacterium]|nr:oligosaccharide flippase family protein [Candidatus Omnitrophota bacterium]